MITMITPTPNWLDVNPTCQTLNVPGFWSSHVLILRSPNSKHPPNQRASKIDIFNPKPAITAKLCGGVLNVYHMNVPGHVNFEESKWSEVVVTPHSPDYGAHGSFFDTNANNAWFKTVLDITKTVGL